MALQQAGIDTTGHTFWLDIEKLSWSTNKTTNQAFVKGMVDEIKNLPTGTELAIYSNYYMWEEIVGLDWKYPEEKGLKLWYAHYDNMRNFSDFKSFGGWAHPVAKQFKGTTKTSCGPSVDYNLANKAQFHARKDENMFLY